MPADAPPLKLRPSGYSCKPILIIGLPDERAEYLSHILMHDLLYASTSTYMDNADDHANKLNKLSSLDGSSLLSLTRVYGGAKFWPDTEVLDQETGKVDMEKLQEIEKGEYQAIIVDDTCYIREPDITAFVTEKYEGETSVAIMGIEGIFNLSLLHRRFDVDWQIAAYTARDFEDEEDYPDGPPPPEPEPGSAAVSAIRGSKSVSYFGFVNPLDVDYGSILLKLCYAADTTGPTVN
ncbi:hypothetical protein ACHAWF_009749 [Thalassiosira exigua]